MSGTVDFTRPYEWKGGTDAGNADFILQDGVIYAWSESNMTYELAWWLESYVPVTGSLVPTLRKERALPEGAWKPSDDSSEPVIDVPIADRGFGT